MLLSVREFSTAIHVRHYVNEHTTITFDLMKTGEPDLITTRLSDMLRWAEAGSIWPLQFGIACCAIEMMAAFSSTYDLDRFGVIPRASPRQSDLLIISGTVTFKMAPRILRLWEQMSEPRYVISMGSCANCGGPYWQHGYHVVNGVDKIIPVDVYVPGCPPRPEALIAGILDLQTQIKAGRRPKPLPPPNEFASTTPSSDTPGQGPTPATPTPTL